MSRIWGHTLGHQLFWQLAAMEPPLMRLAAEQIDAIRKVVRQECGPDVSVRLFGSRLDDASRGGDVDLLVESDLPIERPAVLSSRLSALISRRLGARFGESSRTCW